MAAEKGKKEIHAKQNIGKTIIKRTSKLVTNDNKDGDIRFRRHSWEFKDDPKNVLIQYIKDESLAGPV